MLDFEPHHGLTHVLDKGLGPRAWEDVLEVAGDHISIVKLGWGTAVVTQNLQRKLDVLREKPVVIGGTFFELVYAKSELDAYKRLNDAIKLCADAGDNGTRELLERILEEEEDSIDWHETQLKLVADLGKEHYLAQHIHEG